MPTRRLQSHWLFRRPVGFIECEEPELTLEVALPDAAPPIMTPNRQASGSPPLPNVTPTTEPACCFLAHYATAAPEPGQRITTVGTALEIAPNAVPMNFAETVTAQRLANQFRFYAGITLTCRPGVARSPSGFAYKG